jgi:hypothetical protein
MITTLTLTESQHEVLFRHLYPGDGKEAGALVLCDRADTSKRRRILAHRVFPIPYEASIRSPVFLEWDTEIIVPALDEAAKHGWSVMKFHSHPGGLKAFSLQDDRADKALFPNVHEWVGKGIRHYSGIMMPNREIIYREVTAAGDFIPLSRVLVHGERIHLSEEKNQKKIEGFHLREIQTFGEGTVKKIGGMRFGVVGCSGTGGCIAEAVRRNAAGEVVWVDPEILEIKNLNRVLGSTMADAKNSISKVHLMKKLTDQLEMGTESICSEDLLSTLNALIELSSCDVIFGCVDSVSGRHLLNLFCVYFSIPYFDLGVGIRADGKGGIQSAVAGFHYLQPGKSTLLSRGLYSSSDLAADDLRNGSPEEHQKQVKEGYIKGAAVERPATYTINSMSAAFAFEDFLARLHGYRENGSTYPASRRYSLTHSELFDEKESSFRSYLPWANLVGLGGSFFEREERRFTGKAPKWNSSSTSSSTFRAAEMELESHEFHSMELVEKTSP